jgi:hypothetical protein
MVAVAEMLEHTWHATNLIRPGTEASTPNFRFCAATGQHSTWSAGVQNGGSARALFGLSRVT